MTACASQVGKTAFGRTVAADILANEAGGRGERGKAGGGGGAKNCA